MQFVGHDCGRNPSIEQHALLIFLATRKVEKRVNPYKTHKVGIPIAYTINKGKQSRHAETWFSVPFAVLLRWRLCVCIERNERTWLLYAGTTLGSCVVVHGRGLRRCRHLRSLVFRDEAALEGYREEATQALALSFAFFERPLQFKSNGDFDDVSIV